MTPLGNKYLTQVYKKEARESLLESVSVEAATIVLG